MLNICLPNKFPIFYNTLYFKIYYCNLTSWIFINYTVFNLYAQLLSPYIEFDISSEIEIVLYSTLFLFNVSLLVEPIFIGLLYEKPPFAPMKDSSLSVWLLRIPILSTRPCLPMLSICLFTFYKSLKIFSAAPSS